MSEPMIGEEALQIGDVIRLNSGGPDMTIESIFGDDVFVTWAGGCSEFPAPCLTLITQRSVQ